MDEEGKEREDKEGGQTYDVEGRGSDWDTSMD